MMNQEVVETAGAAPAPASATTVYPEASAGAASPLLGGKEGAGNSAEPSSHSSSSKRLPPPPPISILKESNSTPKTKDSATYRPPTSATFNANNKRLRSPENFNDIKRKKSNRIRWRDDTDLVEIRLFDTFDEEEIGEEGEDADRNSGLSHQDEGEMLRKPRPILEWYSPRGEFGKVIAFYLNSR